MPPDWTALVPLQVPLGMPAAVALHGTALDEVTGVECNTGPAVPANPIPWTLVSPELIMATVPAVQSYSVGTVRIRWPPNESFGYGIQFGTPPPPDPDPAPTITGLDPERVAINTMVGVRVLGTNFAQVNQVTFLIPGDPDQGIPSELVPVAFTIRTASELVFLAPECPRPGVGTVTVRNATGAFGRGMAVYDPRPPIDERPPKPIRERAAWLELDGRTLPLEDPEAGYWCTELDLGYPEPREVVNNRPDGHGVIDRTLYHAGRVVSANIEAYYGGGAVIDEVASSFMPFMLASARPVLHYKLDRSGGERVITLRPMAASAPMIGLESRAVHLQWLAPDPVIRSAEVFEATAWSGSSVASGRQYNLVFNRIYPEGGSVAIVGIIRVGGDVLAQPRLRIYGPVTGPRVSFTTWNTWPGLISDRFDLPFRTVFVLQANEYVELDTLAKTAYMMGDPDRSVLNQMDWLNLRWPALPPIPGQTQMALYGNTTSGVTQVQATWREGFLS